MGMGWGKRDLMTVRDRGADGVALPVEFPLVSMKASTDLECRGTNLGWCTWVY